MRKSVLVILVAALLVGTFPGGTDAYKFIQQDIGHLLSNTLDFIADLMTISGQVEFMGNDCYYIIEPKTLGKSDIIFKAKFWCPTLVPYAGRGESRVHNGAIAWATKNFAKKLERNGVYTREELKIWL